MNSKNIPITIAEGDGIGPEIMGATLAILQAAKAPLEIYKVDIGEKVYLKGFSPVLILPLGMSFATVRLF